MDISDVRNDKPRRNFRKRRGFRFFFGLKNVTFSTLFFSESSFLVLTWKITLPNMNRHGTSATAKRLQCCVSSDSIRKPFRCFYQLLTKKRKLYLKTGFGWNFKLQIAQESYDRYRRFSRLLPQKRTSWKN
jgi:hypothetical protein